MFQDHLDKGYITTRNGNRKVYVKGTNNDGITAGLVVYLLLTDRNVPPDSKQLRLYWRGRDAGIYRHHASRSRETPLG